MVEQFWTFTKVKKINGKNVLIWGGGIYTTIKELFNFVLL